MTVDSSAIVAIVLLQPGWESLSTKILRNPSLISTPTLLETYLVLRPRLGEETSTAVNLLLETLNVQVVPFGIDHYREACAAFDRFGKGRHKASLNFGDCISYAVSSVSGQPLLFVGNDFSLTDVKIA